MEESKRASEQEEPESQKNQRARKSQKESDRGPERYIGRASKTACER